jgi:hypothetical protein
MGANGSGGAYGIFMMNIMNVNMNANVFTGSLSTSGIGIGIEAFNTGSLKETTNSIFTANIIDGEGNGGVGFLTGFSIGNASNTGVHRNSFQNNVIRGTTASGTRHAIDLNGNADDNTFSDNTIDGGANTWDVGIDLGAAVQERNLIRGNRFTSVTLLISDLGTNTVLGDAQHHSTSDPTVNDDAGDGYELGTFWINTTTDNAFILLDETIGAAVWSQIDGGASAITLDDAYTNGQTIGVDAAGDLIFNLTSTEDFIIQDGGTPFATFTDSGDVNFTNNFTVGSATETISNASFVLNGDDVFISDSLGVEGQIYTDATNTKYQWLDLNGGVNTSATVGTVASGLAPSIQYDAGGNSASRWTFPVPDDWVSGTDIVVTVFWSPSNTNTGNVEWDFDYAILNITDVLSGGSFTNVGLTQAAPGTTLELTSTGTTFTIPSGSITADRMASIQINRAGGAGTDTFTGNVNVHMVRIEYTGKKLQ